MNHDEFSNEEKEAFWEHFKKGFEMEPNKFIMRHCQPERSKREDLDRFFPNGKCSFCGKGTWESLHQGCGALNTMET